MKPIEKYADGEELVFKASDRSPFVGAMQNGDITLRGRSIPDDIPLYQESTLKWTDDYIRHHLPI